MFKRGEMTTEQIVLLIILIASFAVILFFILRLDLTSQTSEDICHNSVLVRGGIAKGSSTVSESAVDLQCKREYVCLSYSGDCDKLKDAKIIKVKDENDFYFAIAEEMATCWWMFGEGKVNYVGSDNIPQMYCSLCDQLAFDTSIEKIFPEKKVNLENFYIFMEEHNVSSGITYSEYFFKTNNFVSSLKEDNKEFMNIDLNKHYYILTGMTSDVSTIGWVISGGIVAGSAAVGLALAPFTGGGSLAISAALILGAKVGVGASVISGVFLAPIVKGISGSDHIPPSLIEVGSEEYDLLKCEKILTSS